MIVGKYQDLKKFAGLQERFGAAFDFLNTLVTESPADGHYVMPGCEKTEEVFVNVMTYHTKPVEEAKAEFHKKYIDIQVILEGEEAMLLPLGTSGEVHTPFDEAGDCGFVEMDSVTDMHRIIATKGSFVIFFPGEEHAPSLTNQTVMTVKKMVLKVLM